MPCEKCQKRTIRDEQVKKDLTVRTNKIIGQLNGIKKMIDDDRYCDDILIQLSAVDKAIKSLSAIILNQHLHNCVLNSVKEGDESVLDEITDLFKRFN